MDLDLIASTLYNLWNSSFAEDFSHELFVNSLFGSKLPESSISDSEMYERKTDDYEIIYRPNYWSGDEDTGYVHLLEISYQYNEYIFHLSKDYKLTDRYTHTKSFYIVDSEDLEMIKHFINESEGAVISVSPAPAGAEKVALKVFFDYDSYGEAGVRLFGDSGDCTIDNAWYWNEGKPTPYYNKGSMIWSRIYLDGEDVHWEACDIFGQFTEKGYSEFYDGWYKEEYGIENLEEALDLRKRFILKDEAEIRKALADMGVVVDELIEY